MSELVNFPFVNQLSSPTQDGRLDENRLYNCVPASICAGLRYLTGDNSFEPDTLKDIAYGENWANSGTAASAFVPFCAAHGVRLFAVEHGSVGDAVADAHDWLARGMPVVFTQQDDYSTLAGDTHVCVWYKDTPGTLTAMDPFGAKAITFDDSVWAQRLRSTELWIMEKSMIEITTPGVSAFFKQDTSGAWICLKNGNVIHGGILTFYKQFGGSGLNGLTHLGLPESNEIGLNLAGHPEVVVQRFERASVAYDPSHVLDGPPQAGAVYLTHHAPDASTLQQQLDVAEQKLAQIKQLAS